MYGKLEILMKNYGISFYYKSQLHESDISFNFTHEYSGTYKRSKRTLCSYKE